eukprot:365604-Chlamydomonas_euryale.AAC.11
MRLKAAASAASGKPAAKAPVAARILESSSPHAKEPQMVTRRGPLSHRRDSRAATHVRQLSHCRPLQSHSDRPANTGHNGSRACAPCVSSVPSPPSRSLRALGPRLQGNLTYMSPG